MDVWWLTTYQKEVRWGGGGGGTRLKQTPATTLAPLDGDGHGVDWWEWEREKKKMIFSCSLIVSKDREER